MTQLVISALPELQEQGFPETLSTTFTSIVERYQDFAKSAGDVARASTLIASQSSSATGRVPSSDLKTACQSFSAAINDLLTAVASPNLLDGTPTLALKQTLSLLNAWTSVGSKTTDAQVLAAICSFALPLINSQGSPLTKTAADVYDQAIVVVQTLQNLTRYQQSNASKG
jgi:hypothetical protein